MTQPVQVHHHHYYGPVTLSTPAPPAPAPALAPVVETEEERTMKELYRRWQAVDQIEKIAGYYECHDIYVRTDEYLEFVKEQQKAYPLTERRPANDQFFLLGYPWVLIERIPKREEFTKEWSKRAETMAVLLRNKEEYQPFLDLCNGIRRDDSDFLAFVEMEKFKYPDSRDRSSDDIFFMVEYGRQLWNKAGSPTTSKPAVAEITTDEERQDELKADKDPDVIVEQNNAVLDQDEEFEQKLQEERLLATTKEEHKAISEKKCKQYSEKMGDATISIEQVYKELIYDKDDNELIENYLE